jgi:hypothetical protein
MIENLQDKTGYVRDIHIIKQNILLFGQEEEITITNRINARIEEKEKLLNDNLKLELPAFLRSGELKNFMKILKKKEVL